FAEARNPVLAPAMGLGGGEVMRRVAPGVPAVAVVLANRCPGAITQIGAPAAPAERILVDFVKSGVFLRCHDRPHAPTADRTAAKREEKDTIRAVNEIVPPIPTRFFFLPSPPLRGRGETKGRSGQAQRVVGGADS